MLTDRQMDAALSVFQQRMQGVVDLYYRKMGEHLKTIGRLAPSDVHRLQQIRRLNRNLAEVKRQLARAAGMNVRDIEKVLEQAAEVDDRVIRKITGISDASVRLPNNEALQRALRAQIAEAGPRLANLSKTTVDQSAYRKAVDAAVTAVQSGAEDYESAIRRTLREAGSMGLRVRDTGTSAVEYESGHTRRVDTAVRMNVLDAMRRMNQRVMEEVGRQFGANGVEIDAHMLCAEDHLPYQGQQFSDAEFDEIQSSLPRPFGEWNCRHTWQPIIVGISPRAYTDEDLERFERYSTEEVTIDGKTHTRYEWSQVMRRMETAIREKKDTATLAAAAGDDQLRRQCQGSITAMVKEYERLSDRTGLGPDFRRTYVAGFKDANERALTNGVRDDTMLSDSTNGRHVITQESIDSVPRFTEFATPEINHAVYKASVELLEYLAKDPVGTEAIIVLPLSKVIEYNEGRLDLIKEGLKDKGSLGKGHVSPIDLDEPYFAIHNHPGCKTFSFNDVDTLGRYTNCIGIVAIGNNGRSAYSMIKGDDYDHNAFSWFRGMISVGRIMYKAKDSFLKGVEEYGIRYTSRSD